MNNPLEKVDGVIDALGTAGAKASQSFWSLVLLACLLAALVFLMFQQNKDSSQRSSERQETLLKILISQEQRIEQLTENLIIEAPDKVDEANRIEYEARQAAMEDALHQLQGVQSQLLEEVKIIRKSRENADQSRFQDNNEGISKLVARETHNVSFKRILKLGSYRIAGSHLAIRDVFHMVRF